MVFFFSGTGNSEWVAKELAKQLQLPTVRVHCRAESHPDVAQSRYILFVFPVHSWGPALPMLDFIDRLQWQNYHGQPIYAVCTCGDDCGRTDKIVQRHLKNFTLQATFSVTMPNSYLLLPGFDVDPIAVEQAKLQQAPQRVAQIVEAIRQQKAAPELYHAGSLAALKSCVYPLFRRYTKRKTAYYATEACTKCERCAKLCPTANIQVSREEGPQWGNHCVQCLACIHQCPMRAIEYGKITLKKGRYKHPSLTNSTK